MLEQCKAHIFYVNTILPHYNNIINHNTKKSNTYFYIFHYFHTVYIYIANVYNIRFNSVFLYAKM